jgi:ankyrin repeat protein
MKMLRLLIKHGLDVNLEGFDGRTPIHFAVAAGNIEAVSTLLPEGAQCESHDGDGCTPLQIATMLGFDLVASELLEHSASVDARMLAISQNS